MKPATKNRQQGAALLVLISIIVAALAFLLVKALSSNSTSGRDQANAAALSQAKQALIGFAATYRDMNANQVFGYLPCPDTDNNGVINAPCGAQDVSVMRRLPWNTLGLPPLRDSAGECLWYAVSGRAKDNPKTDVFNWDTAGQFQIEDADGAVLFAAGTHDTPLAVIFAPGSVLASQDRTPVAGVSECGGNNTAAAYLDGTDTLYSATAPASGVSSTLTLATDSSIRAGSNNDRAQWITGAEIFDRVKVRSDFKTDIDTMLGDLQTCLNTIPAGSLPAASFGNKGMDNVLAACPVDASCPALPRTQKCNVRVNWQNNLLYSKTAATSTVNGETGCSAVLFFGGERTAAQTRITAGQQGDDAMYLEGSNATVFPGSGSYTGATSFSSASASDDIALCIKGLSAAPTEISFAGDFPSFIQAGAGVAPNPASKTVAITPAAGTGGGCFWLPGTVALAGKTVRAYYDYRFTNADPVGGTDRGNGFTLDMVDGSLGSPTALCGLESNMGAFAIAGGPGAMWAGESFVIETDVRRDGGNADPAANHTAIMAYGNPQHSATNGNPTAACNGTAAGCRASPANKFEESPAPLSHNQRIEIVSGCDASCTSCNPAFHAAPNNYVKISAWVDCASCNDVTVNHAATPTIRRCIILDPAMDSPYIAFTGGFRSGGSAQGVTLSNFILRSE